MAASSGYWLQRVTPYASSTPAKYLVYGIESCSVSVVDWRVVRSDVVIVHVQTPARLQDELTMVPRIRCPGPVGTRALWTPTSLSSMRWARSLRIDQPSV